VSTQSPARRTLPLLLSAAAAVSCGRFSRPCRRPCCPGRRVWRSGGPTRPPDHRHVDAIGQAGEAGLAADREQLVPVWSRGAAGCSDQGGRHAVQQAAVVPRAAAGRRADGQARKDSGQDLAALPPPPPSPAVSLDLPIAAAAALTAVRHGLACVAGGAGQLAACNSPGGESPVLRSRPWGACVWVCVCAVCVSVCTESCGAELNTGCPQRNGGQRNGGYDGARLQQDRPSPPTPSVTPGAPLAAPRSLIHAVSHHSPLGITTTSTHLTTQPLRCGSLSALAPLAAAAAALLLGHISGPPRGALGRSIGRESVALL
jgi:hypothetical protein